MATSCSPYPLYAFGRFCELGRSGGLAMRKYDAEMEAWRNRGLPIGACFLSADETALIKRTGENTWKVEVVRIVYDQPTESGEPIHG